MNSSIYHHNTVEAPRTHAEERTMLEQAIAASLGQPVDEQALLVARRQAETRSSLLTQGPPGQYRPHLVAMKRPKGGVYC
jgi:hypothetical protein